MKQRFHLQRYIVTEGCRYAWQSLKNCIKVSIGRGIYPDERLVFFRHYVLHLLGFRPIRAITCLINGTSEGPGSQATLVMKTICLARASGLPYLHSPLTVVAGADRPMKEWALAWEAVFNLGAGEAPCEPKSRGVIRNGYLVMGDIELWLGWRGRREELKDLYRSLIPEFRRKYYLNKSQRTTPDVRVVVNIRRREVSAHKYHPMYTSNDKILRIASAVKSVLESRGVPFSMSVCGQGGTAEFEALSSLGAEFYLNADPIWTFQELAEADILVVAKSCFSRYAGIMSDGIKVFEEAAMWTDIPATDDWIPCEPDGSFDRTAFEHQLTLLLQAKEKSGTTGSSLARQ